MRKWVNARSIQYKNEKLHRTDREDVTNLSFTFFDVERDAQQIIFINNFFITRIYVEVLKYICKKCVNFTLITVWRKKYYEFYLFNNSNEKNIIKRWNHITI